MFRLVNIRIRQQKCKDIPQGRQSFLQHKWLHEQEHHILLWPRIYNGTPLGWSRYMQTEENDEIAKKKFKDIENYLSTVESV